MKAKMPRTTAELVTLAELAARQLEAAFQFGIVKDADEILKIRHRMLRSEAFRTLVQIEFARRTGDAFKWAELTEPSDGCYDEASLDAFAVGEVPEMVDHVRSCAACQFQLAVIRAQMIEAEEIAAQLRLPPADLRSWMLFSIKVVQKTAREVADQTTLAVNKIADVFVQLPRRLAEGIPAYVPMIATVDATLGDGEAASDDPRYRIEYRSQLGEIEVGFDFTRQTLMMAKVQPALAQEASLDGPLLMFVDNQVVRPQSEGTDDAGSPRERWFCYPRIPSGEAQFQFEGRILREVESMLDQYSEETRERRESAAEMALRIGCSSADSLMLRLLESSSESTQLAILAATIAKVRLDGSLREGLARGFLTMGANLKQSPNHSIREAASELLSLLLN